MTTQPGQLDETLEEEDVQEEEEIDSPQFFTRDEVLGLISTAKSEAEEAAFRRAQMRMEGELNSQKDRRFNDLTREIAELKQNIATRDSRQAFEEAVSGLDEDQQKALRIIWDRSSTSASPARVEVEPQVQQPQNAQEQDIVRQLEAHVQSFGIAAKWGDNNSVWSNLTSTDAVQFMGQLNKNIQDTLRKQGAESARPSNGRRNEPPPAMTPRASAGRIRNADDLIDAHLRDEITTDEYNRRKGEFGLR